MPLIFATPAFLWPLRGGPQGVPGGRGRPVRGQVRGSLCKWQRERLVGKGHNPACMRLRSHFGSVVIVVVGGGVVVCSLGFACRLWAAAIFTALRIQRTAWSESGAGDHHRASPCANSRCLLWKRITKSGRVTAQHVSFPPWKSDDVEAQQRPHRIRRVHDRQTVGKTRGHAGGPEVEARKWGAPPGHVSDPLSEPAPGLKKR
jgi:hypothetical protein